MTKAAELREMSDEHLALSLKDTTKNLFHLRLQAQTERLDAPSELRKQRRIIARIKTIQNQRAGATPRRKPPPPNQLKPRDCRHAEASGNRNRSQRQDGQDAPRGNPPAGAARAVRQVRPPQDHLPRTRRAQRVAHGRPGGDRRVAAALAHQALGLGAGGGEGADAGPGGDAGRLAAAQRAPETAPTAEEQP